MGRAGPGSAVSQEIGVKPGDVRRTAATLLSGITVGLLFEDQKVFDVVVWGTPEIRRSVADVEALAIETPRGGIVRLADVADVRIAPNAAVIRHESVFNYLDVTAGVRGRDVDAVAQDIEAAIKRIEFPLEHHAELVGDYADGREARGRVVVGALAAALAIFLLLQAAFNSWRLAALAFVTLPAALVGGLLAASVTSGTLTLGSIAGLAAVLGIAARRAERTPERGVLLYALPPTVMTRKPDWVDTGAGRHADAFDAGGVRLWTSFGIPMAPW